MPETIEQLRQQHDELRQQLSDIGDMRPGTLIGRYRKCGKPNCHCAQPDDPGHGPSWSLTRRVAGKTVTKVIPVSALERTQEQLEEFHRFRALSQQLVELSVRLCDAQLKSSTKASLAEAEKRGSKAPSHKRSAKKLKPS